MGSQVDNLKSKIVKMEKENMKVSQKEREDALLAKEASA